MILQHITEDLTIGCEVYSNNRTWGHIAKAFYGGREIEAIKYTYQNRTWEAKQFDSVKAGLLFKLDNTKSTPLKDRYAFAQLIART